MLLAVIGLAAAWAASRSPLAEKSTTQVPDEPFRHVYVQSRVGSADKCLVTDRAGATTRRSEPDLSKARWKCHWSAGPEGPVLSALTGKEPSFLFIPESAVVDPAQPFVYEAVRGSENLPLPRVRWVHLFFDRAYRGFYLQIRLPDKELMTKHELGRGEFLETHGDSAACWNRKLEASCVLWNSAFIAEAIFPDPAWTPGLTLLHELLAAASLESRAFVLTEQPSDARHLWPWPLPVDLARQLRGSDSGAGRYRDQRYVHWSRPSVTAMPRTDAAALDLPSASEARAALIEAVGKEAGPSMTQRLDRSSTLVWLSSEGDR